MPPAPQHVPHRAFPFAEPPFDSGSSDSDTESGEDERSHTGFRPSGGSGRGGWGRGYPGPDPYAQDAGVVPPDEQWIHNLVAGSNGGARKPIPDFGTSVTVLT